MQAQTPDTGGAGRITPQEKRRSCVLYLWNMTPLRQPRIGHCFQAFAVFSAGDNQCIVHSEDLCTECAHALDHSILRAQTHGRGRV